MRKLTALLFGGAGYVLGARAGRQRYEQIRNWAMQVQNNPKVQQAASQAADAANKAAPVVKDKVSSATSKTKSSSGDSSDVASTTTMTGTTTPSTTAGMSTGITDVDPLVDDLGTAPISTTGTTSTGFPPA